MCEGDAGHLLQIKNQAFNQYERNTQGQQVNLDRFNHELNRELPASCLHDLPQADLPVFLIVTGFKIHKMANQKAG